MLALNAFFTSAVKLSWVMFAVLVAKLAMPCSVFLHNQIMFGVRISTRIHCTSWLT